MLWWGLAGAGAAAGAAGLAACGAGGGPEAVTRSDAPVTVEIWDSPPADDFAPYWENVLLARFRARFPQARVEISWPGWDQIEAKLITATVGGGMPQLFRMGASFVPNAADSGLALALDDRVRQWGQRGDFFDGSWNTVVWRGRAWGIPQLTAPRMWSYRKDLADEAGVRVDDGWTWEQQVALARQATRGDAERVARLGASPVESNSHEWTAMLYAAGGRRTKGGRPAFQGSEGQWALQTQIDRRNAILPPGRQGPPAPPSGSSHLAAGTTVMIYGNMAVAAVVQRAAPNTLQYLTVPLPPTKAKRVSNTNTDWLAIGKTAAAQDVAWELLKLIGEPEALVAFCETNFRIPPRKTAAQRAGFMQFPFMRRAVEVHERYGMPAPLVPSYARLNPIIEEAMTAAFGGQKSVRQALDDAAAQWSPILAEARWDD
jgi:multiple sugar transport system substrate-binding protein